MNRYTFIIEIKGGTYIEQVTSQNVNAAKNSWVKTLNNEFILNISDEELELLKIKILEEDPVSISNVVNVWCLSLFLKKNYVLVNIVLTV